MLVIFWTDKFIALRNWSEIVNLQKHFSHMDITTTVAVVMKGIRVHFKRTISYPFHNYQHSHETLQRAYIAILDDNPNSQKGARGRLFVWNP